MAASLRSALSVSNPRPVWLITGAHAVNEFYSVALPPVLPLLVADFDITYAAAGALVAIYYVVYSTFQLPAGRLADRFGKRRLLAVGMVGLAVGILLAGVAPGYPMLVGAMVVAGIGGATYHPTGMSLISDLESGATEGRAMGVHGFGGVAGTALAPALIGGVAAMADWRIALVTAAGVGVVYAVMFWRLFPHSAAEGSETRRPAGDGGAGEWSPSAAVSSDEPIHVRLASALNVPVAGWVVGLFVTNLFLATEVGAARTFTTSYLFVRLGESTTLANAVFFLMLVGAGGSSIVIGHLADRFDRRRLGIATFAVTAAMLLATNAVPASPAVMLGWFFVLGAAMFATAPAINAITAAHADRSFSGSLFGVTLTAGAIGSGLGPLLFGLAAESVGVRWAFQAIAVTSVLGAVSFAVMLHD